MQFSKLLPLGFLILLASTGGAEPQPSSPKRWNVLILTVDCMRPDHLSLYGYERPTTPALDAFAKEAWVFENAFATSAWTSPGILSMLTGYYPPVHAQNARHSFYDEHLSSALRVFEKAGYRTIGRQNSGANYRGIGFQEEVGGQDMEEFVRHRAADAERAGEEGAAPFFGWLHTKEPHLPYAPTEENAGLFTDATAAPSPGVQAVREHHVILRDPTVPVKFSHAGAVSFNEADPEDIRAVYDETVRDADDHLGRAFAALRETGLLESTVVIISADHGEELLEHGWVGHASTSYDGKLTDELVRIPLVIRFPDGRAGRSDALVQGIDLMPSLFDWLGLSGEGLTPPMQGVSLAPLVSGEKTAVRDLVYLQTTRKGWTTPKKEMQTRVTAVRSLDQKVIWIPAEQGEPARIEAYDLRQDPGEQKDLAGTHREEFKALFDARDEWDRRNRAAAADLVLPAGRKHATDLTEALDKKDLVAATDAWRRLRILDRTWGFEEAPFYEGEGADAEAWRGLRRGASEALAKALAEDAAQ